ncbi:MAG: MBL fold metallo-hydrolase [Clostridia bacterium]|nr:MBL fold metallo-hydrolase [Clostridia bacterium]
MRLTILGMNGPYPAPESACSGYLVTSGDTAIQLDLGTGTLSALTARMPPESLTALVFSHWHFDHCSDALPLIFRLADHAGDRPLPVYGPKDDASPVRRALAGCPQVALHDLSAGDTVQLGTVCLTAYAARHPVPGLMYRLDDGTSVLCFTGDTNTTESLPAFAKGADLLLADGLFTTRLWAEGKPHLSAYLAAALARDAGAKQLVITHLNPFIDPATLLKEARSAYPRAVLAQCGDVYEC